MEDEDPMHGGTFSFAIGELSRKMSRSIGSLFSSDDEHDHEHEAMPSSTLQMSRLHREEEVSQHHDEIDMFESRGKESEECRSSGDSDYRYTRSSDIGSIDMLTRGSVGSLGDSLGE